MGHVATGVNPTDNIPNAGDAAPPMRGTLALGGTERVGCGTDRAGGRICASFPAPSGLSGEVRVITGNATPDTRTRLDCDSGSDRLCFRDTEWIGRRLGKGGPMLLGLDRSKEGFALFRFPPEGSSRATALTCEQRGHGGPPASSPIGQATMGCVALGVAEPALTPTTIREPCPDRTH